MSRTSKTFRLIAFAVLALSTVSCSEYKKVVLFQDATDGVVAETSAKRSIVLEPSDQLSIVVNSKDPKLASLFNLPVVSYQAGSAVSGESNSTNRLSLYTIDIDGNIDFPVLGTIHIAGMSRTDAARLIKNKLVEGNYLKDAVVTIELSDVYITVMGDVAKPARYAIQKDIVTITDALGMAGDLNITGNRRVVKVFREENGKQKCYVVNMTSAKEMFSSPAYYLKQRDIVYVEPNEMKARQSTVNGNTLLSASFWVSIGSLLVTVINLLIVALK